MLPLLIPSSCVNVGSCGLATLWNENRAGPAFDRSYEVDVVALNLGFQPETGLARALGAKQRFVDVGLGHLASETDEDGRTSVAGVFAGGDCIRAQNAASTVMAVQDGKLAAMAIHQRIMSKEANVRG